MDEACVRRSLRHTCCGLVKRTNRRLLAGRASLAAVPDRAQAGHSISPACGGSNPCLCPTQLSPHRGKQKSVVIREIYCTSRRRMETPSLPTEGDPSSMRQQGARLPTPQGSDADRAASLPCTATTPPQRTRASRPWAYCPGLL
jgi:hypothetical protein